MVGGGAEWQEPLGARWQAKLMHKHVRTHRRLHARVHTQTLAHTHAHTHTYTHTRTHTGDLHFFSYDVMTPQVKLGTLDPAGNLIHSLKVCASCVSERVRVCVCTCVMTHARMRVCMCSLPGEPIYERVRTAIQLL